MSSYTIPIATSNNAGNLQAVITNSYGSVTSQLAVLTVAAPGLGTTVTSLVTDGLVLWLTFEQSDGWTTNHVITDKSGKGNHAYYMPSATHNTWPAWTNGPNGLSAAQFVANYTNAGGYRQGTYAAITSLSTNAANSGLAAFTNATWACWAYINNEHIVGESGDDMFLSCGQDVNNWFFGRYYQNTPQFSRATTSNGQEPLETYAVWPSINTSSWAHYAIVWNGTNTMAYLNGILYTNSLDWTNRGTFTLTNQYRNDTIYSAVWTNYATVPPSLYTNSYYGGMTGTNSIMPPWSYIGVGVNTHSGMADADSQYGPNNGQLAGRLADVRIYNRALSSQEIADVYRPRWVGPTPRVISVQHQ
jgi:hypothetical protein